MLVFVGRLVQEKGVADLLAAVHLLRDTCPDLTALVIGEGQDRDAFAHQAAELGIDDRVYFTGWVQNHSVAAHIAAADVFVSPSRRASNGWVEAQGLAMLEAIAAGTPVIATAEGGVVDAVTHRETGLLVQHRAPDQIAAVVLQLVRDPRLAGQLAATARDRVERRFSRASSAGAFLALFQDLLAPRVGV
jgi:glycosyltransferase involved in cell wall biosynthesis